MKWPEEKANDWYARQPWLVGSNYIPATAVNQLEMWQNDTFDIDRINLEFIWAENLGMNTMRVFLHDLLWKQDPGGFRKRIDKFLSVAKKHHIKPIFVLLDSCWDPFPELFHQRPPQPGIHNSRWVQSPGANALADPKQQPRILEYVANVILAFADDDRILAWDVWNEPDNLNGSSYGRVERPDKEKLVLELLPKVFQYARSGRPSQPLTSGLWKGDWSSPDKLSADREDPGGAVGHHFLPQLRQARGVRKAGAVAAAVQASDPLHGVHGAAERQHVRRHPADREEVQGGGVQLGLRRGQDADVAAVGFVAEAVRRRSPAGRCGSTTFSSRTARRTVRRKWISSRGSSRSLPRRRQRRRGRSSGVML